MPKRIRIPLPCQVSSDDDGSEPGSAISRRETIKSRTPLYGEPITPKTNWIITDFSVVGQPVTRTELNL